MQMLLEAEGFAVSLAADGEEALRLQRDVPADVVITDIFMPGKEGIETIYELRKQFPARARKATTSASPASSGQ